MIRGATFPQSRLDRVVTSRDVLLQVQVRMRMCTCIFRGDSTCVFFTHHHARYTNRDPHNPQKPLTTLPSPADP